MATYGAAPLALQILGNSLVKDTQQYQNGVTMVQNVHRMFGPQANVSQFAANVVRAARANESLSSSMIDDFEVYPVRLMAEIVGVNPLISVCLPIEYAGKANVMIERKWASHDVHAQQLPEEAPMPHVTLEIERRKYTLNRFGKDAKRS
jgi:hypothetical protein